LCRRYAVNPRRQIFNILSQLRREPLAPSGSRDLINSLHGLRVVAVLVCMVLAGFFSMMGCLDGMSVGDLLHDDRLSHGFLPHGVVRQRDGASLRVRGALLRSDGARRLLWTCFFSLIDAWVSSNPDPC
jgi:hypothetical protein